MVKSNEQAIQEAAYFIWQNAGCPQGQDEYFWSMAVEQFNKNNSKSSSKSSTASKSCSASKKCASASSKAKTSSGKSSSAKKSSK